MISEMRSSTFQREKYPTNECIKDLDNNLATSKSQIFMEALIRSHVKQASIRQCIASAICPQSTIPPLLFGLAVEMDHVSGSK